MHDATYLRDTYEVGVVVRSAPADPKGFVVVTAYPRNEDKQKKKKNMATRLIDAPQAFFNFAQGFNQDARYFETMDDLIRFCLLFIRRNQMPDFIKFADRVERGEFTTMELEKLWRHTDSDYFVIHDGVRRLMRRAREIAIREGGDGSLYTRKVEFTLEPMLKFEL